MIKQLGILKLKILIILGVSDQLHEHPQIIIPYLPFKLILTMENELSTIIQRCYMLCNAFNILYLYKPTNSNLAIN